MQRHRLIPAPSYEVLSSDWHETLAGGPEPVRHVQTRIVEPIPFREVPYPPRDSDFNDRPSWLQMVYDLWWPQDSTWQVVSPSLRVQEPGPFNVPVGETHSLIGEPLAQMPQGEQLALGLRTNIRQPSPYGQGELSDAAFELYPSEV